MVKAQDPVSLYGSGDSSFLKALLLESFSRNHVFSKVVIVALMLRKLYSLFFLII
jgi:hypothetical protein